MRNRQTVLLIIETLALILLTVSFYRPFGERSRREFGRTKVFHYSGTKMEELPDFCTWTQSSRCGKMKTARGDVPLYVHDSPNDPVSRMVLTEGNFERRTLDVVLAEVKQAPGSTFVDIGANVGVFAITVASDLQVPVVAVDPVFASMVLLCKNVRVNGLTDNITLIVNAVSDSVKETHLQIFPDNYPIAQVASSEGMESECQDRPTFSITLDDLIPFMTTKSAVLKIDVESHEYHVIKGGSRFLQEIEVPAIIMEWNHVRQTPDVEKLLEILRTNGFHPYRPTLDYSALSYSEDLPKIQDILWLKRKV